MLHYQYICIEGNIGAGKTTLASALASATGSRLILETFEENPYLPLFYKDPERYALQTELTFLTDRYKQLSTELLNRSLFQPHTIADYHLYKSRLFARNNLNDIDFKLYVKVFTIIEASLPRPDLMIFLHCETGKLMDNIRTRGRSYEKHISDKYLAALSQAYIRYIRMENRFPILMLNMDQRDFISKPEEINKIIPFLHQEFPKGITRIVP